MSIRLDTVAVADDRKLAGSSMPRQMLITRCRGIAAVQGRMLAMKWGPARKGAACRVPPCR